MTPKQNKITEKSDTTQLKEYLTSDIRVTNPLSVTLTSRQWVDGQKLDQISLERDITFFLNRLNYKLFKKKFSRHGKKLGVISVIEGDEYTKFHVHLTLECPPKIPVWFMEHLIKKCWAKTKFGYSYDKKHGVKVDSVIDEGWISYQLKNRTKQDGVISSIDWVNTTRSVTE